MISKCFIKNLENIDSRVDENPIVYSLVGDIIGIFFSFDWRAMSKFLTYLYKLVNIKYSTLYNLITNR